VKCGPGIDVAFYDAGDQVAHDCELRLRTAAPALPMVARANADAAALLAHLPDPGSAE